jgi:membrane AbrB-like protein
MILPTVTSLGVGSLGAALAWWLGAPAPFLTGPALFVSLAAVAGLPVDLPPPLRNLCFLFGGLNLGTGVTPEALNNALRWPASLIAMVVTIVAFMGLGSWYMRRVVGCDDRTAMLATTPGHLSFVLGLGMETGANLAIVSVGQSLRVLMLTLSVPAFVAVFTDADLSMAGMPGAEMVLPHLGVLVVLAAATGFLFLRLKVPAAFLLGAMLISVIGHGSDLTPGRVPQGLSMAAFVTMGTIIGTRFNGISGRQVAQSAVTALVLTIGGFVLVLLASLAVNAAVGLPVKDVLIALAPGALETMIAMSAVIGADPTFVGFHHVARLAFLSLFIPVALSRTSGQKRP